MCLLELIMFQSSYVPAAQEFVVLGARTQYDTVTKDLFTSCSWFESLFKGQIELIGWNVQSGALGYFRELRSGIYNKKSHKCCIFVLFFIFRNVLFVAVWAIFIIMYLLIRRSSKILFTSGMCLCFISLKMSLVLKSPEICLQSYTGNLE